MVWRVRSLTHGGAVVLMLAVTLLWSTAGVATRHLSANNSFEITFWRSLFTALSLLIILPLWRGRTVWADMRRAGLALWVSGLCWATMFTAFMVALTLTSVANVLVTMALGPLFTAIIARIFIGNRVPVRTWTAIGVAGLGVYFMFAHQLSSDRWLGSVVALCVPLAAAVNWTVTQHAHAQGRHLDMVPALLVGAGLSCLLVLPWALPFHATAQDISLLGLLGLFQLALPCAACVVCATVLKAPEVALLALLEVPFGIALAWAGAGESPHPSVLLGGGMVLGALIVNEAVALLQRKAIP